MRKLLPWLPLAVLPAFAFAADAVTAPNPPVREKQELSSASAVVLDMAKSIAFMEQGQAYYKAYAKGSHKAEDNKAFVRFAEYYDRELSTVKKELEVVKLWVDKKSELKPD